MKWHAVITILYKSPPARVVNSPFLSPPARVAWIETGKSARKYTGAEVATREGGVDRNMSSFASASPDLLSPPARVAWIETRNAVLFTVDNDVATREGGVDRNFENKNAVLPLLDVATREGGVDRNVIGRVALAEAGGRHPRGWRG